MSATFITNLPSENNPNSAYRVKVECFLKSFTLTIVDNKVAYKGEISSESITEQSKMLNISEDEYLIEFKNALKNSLEPNVFTFSLENEQFYVKKRLKPSSSMKIKFGIVKLKQVDFMDAFTDMLDVSLCENKKCFLEIEKLRANNVALTEGNELLLQELENLQKDKNNMENVLYSQFLNLLNSKKEEIRKLRNKLGMEVDEDMDTEEDMEVERKINEPEEIFDVDTDVDEDPEKNIESVIEVQPNIIDQSKPKKKEWNIKDYLDSTEEENEKSGPSNVRSILNSMSFLDPTVPFEA